MTTLPDLVAAVDQAAAAEVLNVQQALFEPEEIGGEEGRPRFGFRGRVGRQPHGDAEHFGRFFGFRTLCDVEESILNAPFAAQCQGRKVAVCVVLVYIVRRAVAENRENRKTEKKPFVEHCYQQNLPGRDQIPI